MHDAFVCIAMAAGSKTDVGAYAKGDQQAEFELGNARCGAGGALKKDETSGTYSLESDAAAAGLSGQFSLQDHRPLDEVVRDLMKGGFVPSWCTACYRLGRTGEAFMKIAKKGDIHSFCHPNSLLTLQVRAHGAAHRCASRIERALVRRSTWRTTPSPRRRSSGSK